MPTTLVTGAAGFIGSHLVRGLLQAGHVVVAIDDLSGGFTDNLPDGVDFIRGSVNDARLVNDVFRQYKINYVYHLAAYAAEGLSHFIKHFNYSNNLLGSVNLINAAVNHDVRCFVFTSSIAVYGSNQVPMREDMVPVPEDSYGIAKLAVEQELRITHEMFGLDYVIFRPHNVYGEYQNIGDRYRNVIGIFMNQILQGQPMTVFGDGTQTRAFTYVGDIVPPMVNAIREPAAYNQIFNIGADTPYSVGELAESVASAMGVAPCIVHLPRRNEVAHAYADHSRAAQVLRHRAETPLEEGLARMARWARTVGARKSSPFENIEIRRNMPPSWTE